MPGRRGVREKGRGQRIRSSGGTASSLGGGDQAPGRTVMFCHRSQYLWGGPTGNSKSAQQESSGGFTERPGEKCSTRNVGAKEELRRGLLKDEPLIATLNE